jgi:hypothetical protein
VSARFKNIPTYLTVQRETLTNIRGNLTTKQHCSKENHGEFAKPTSRNEKDSIMTKTANIKNTKMFTSKQGCGCERFISDPTQDPDPNFKEVSVPPQDATPTSESEVVVCGRNVVVPPPLLLLPHGEGKPPPLLPPRAISVTPVMRTEMGL